MIGPGTGVRVYLAVRQCRSDHWRDLAHRHRYAQGDRGSGGLGPGRAASEACQRRGLCLSRPSRRQVEAALLGWTGLLPLLQGFGARALPLAWRRRGRDAFDLGATCHAVGGDRLATPRLGRAACACWVDYLYELPCFIGLECLCMVSIGMSDDADILSDDPAVLKAMIAALQA